MKKLFVILPAFAFAFALSFSAASASFMFPHFPMHQSSGIEVNSSNDAYVLNDVSATANTGDNEANHNGDSKKKHRGYWGAWSYGGGSGLGEIMTGDAFADNTVDTTANSNDIEIDSDCGCKGKIKVNADNQASVKNYVTASANTGYNVANHNGGTGSITTGDALAQNSVANLLNSNVIKITR